MISCKVSRAKFVRYGSRLVYSMTFAVLAAGGVIIDSHAAPSLSPSMLKQIQKLSPTEQRDLAKQYGVTLPTSMAWEGAESQEPLPLPLKQNVLDDLIDPELDQASWVIDRAASEEEPLARFGSQLFSGDLETYAPSDMTLVPSDYMLGPGDELSVRVFGKDAMEAIVEVNLAGQITLPNVGSISLLGLSFEEARRVVSQHVKRRLMGSDVVTSLAKLRQISIFLAGEVNAPGNYNVSALTSISQALYLSGGLTDIGSYREIQVRRKDSVVARFDLYDLLLQGRRTDDITLQSGDVVFVPVVDGIVAIEGAIRRPGRYDLKENETFVDLIAIAGGFAANAFQQSTTIQRHDSIRGFPSVLTVSDPNSKIILHDGDVLVVREGTTELGNTVELLGAVVRPGLYEFSIGARVSDFLGAVGRDVLSNADLAVGLIVRRVNSRLDIEVLAFDLVAVTQEPGGERDLLLQSFDKIVVLPIPKIFKDIESNVMSKTERGEKTSKFYDKGTALVSAQERILSRKSLLKPIIEKLRAQAGSGQSVALVKVQGAVKEPGEYPLIAGGGLGFLVELAGGLEDGAYQKAIEVRRIKTTDEGAFIEIFTVDLRDDSKLELESRDVIRINYLPDWNPDETVELSGEVRFPGNYALREGETIGSILRRAGGFSDKAFPEATRFTSLATKELQQVNVRMLIERFEREQSSRRSVGEVDEGSRLIEEGFASSIIDSFQGRLIIDIQSILAGVESADVLLQDGDKLFVPRLVESVTVAGEVYQPGSFRFESDLNYTDYLALSAGITDRARRKDIYVIAPNGSVTPMGRSKRQLLRFDRAGVGISPGSVIVVPTNYDYQKPLDRYRGITSVVFESVASIAAFLSISEK